MGKCFCKLITKEYSFALAKKDLFKNFEDFNFVEKDNFVSGGEMSFRAPKNKALKIFRNLCEFYPYEEARLYIEDQENNYVYVNKEGTIKLTDF